MKKKFFAVLVSIAIILSTMPFAFSASAQDKLVKGNTLYDIKADDRTDDVPEGFGKADGSSNGRVWTDKSVYLNGENFEVKLSALAQEYIATNVDISMSTIGVDVVMILDMSGSMRNNKLELDEYDGSTDKNATRTKAMVKALNEAIETIMVANPNNRVTIYTFQNSTPVSVNLIPLEHYTNTSWTDDQVWKNTGTNTGSGKYLNYSVNNSNDVVTTNASLKNSAGTTLKQTSCSSGSGTPTQFGIQTGIQGLISQLNAKSYDYERVPFVLLFTDGIPGTASKTAANAFSNTPQKTGLLSHQNNGSNEITAYTILTAAYQKDQLEAAYSNYNQRHKGDSAYEVHWYNIGLGVDNTDDAAQGHAFLDPSTVLDGSNSHANNSGSTFNSTKGIKSYIASAATGTYASYAENYVYVEGENFIYFANTSSALTRAFNNLANDIKEASQEVGNPVTTVTSEGQSATREMVFTDVIGDNLLLNKTTFALTANGKKTNAVYNEATDTYTFAGFGTTVKVLKTSPATVVWTIPAEEVPVFSFANRRQLVNDDGTYSYKTASPISLTYTVEIPAGLEEKGYTNAFVSSGDKVTATAKAEYGVLNDNPWYYDINFKANGEFDYSTVKEISPVAKNSNNTETADYSYAFEAKQVYDSGYTADTSLGNNGAAIPMLRVTKTSDETDGTVYPNQEITYTIVIENLTDEAIDDIVLKDLIPDGFTFKEGDDEVSNSGSTVTITVDSLDGGTDITVEYTVTVDDDVTDGAEIKTTDPRFSSVDGEDIADENKTNDDLDVTVDATEYTVSYSWGDYTPAGYTLPSDETYFNEESFTADYSKIEKGTVVEVKDAYGNVTDKYTFNGWSQDSGKIDGDDIQLTANWSHETIQPTQYSVTYTWSGDVPAGALLPTNNTGLVNNQPFTVDKTYTKDSKVEVKDAYGNVTGVYTFSGWNTSDGKVNGNNVAISGTWSYEEKTLDEYSVSYSWTGLPADLAAEHKAPEDNNTYINNQPYTVDTTCKKGDVIEVKDAYGNVTDTYTFSGWNVTEGVIDGKDADIKGSWTHKTVTVPEYTISYSWGDFNPGTALPEDNNKYVNNQPFTVKDGIAVGTQFPVKDENGGIVAYKVFTGWDTADGVVDGENVKVTAKWNTVAADGLSITYQWTSDAPDGVTPPTDNGTYYEGYKYTLENPDYTAIENGKYVYRTENGKYTFNGWDKAESGTITDSMTVSGTWIKEEPKSVNYSFDSNAPYGIDAPEDNNVYYNGETFTVKNPEKTEVIDNEGNKWTFDGWNKSSGTVGNNDIEVSGSWTKEEPKSITYSFGDFTPADVDLPQDTTKYYTGDSYTIGSADIKAGDTFVDNNGVKWTFDGWDKTGGTIGNDDVEVTAKWTTEEAKKINYSFGEFTPSGVVLPEDSKFYHDGDKFEVTSENLKIGDKFTDGEGNMWIFAGWSETEGTIDGSDVTITAQWSQKEPRTISYEWNSDAPAEVVLPKDNTVYYDGDSFTAKSPANETIIDNNGVKWTFDGWNVTDGTVNGDVLITGTWTSEEGKTISYNWGKFTPSDATIPTDDTIYHNGDEFKVDTDTIKHGDSFVDDNGVKWTFDKWSEEDGVIDGSDVTIVAEWTSEEGKTISYNWGEFTPDGFEIPTDDKIYHDGDEFEVKDPGIEKDESFIDKDGNKWTFDGWNTDSGIVGEDNIEITPVWTKEAPKTISYNWSGDTPDGAVLPTDNNNYYNGDEYKSADKPEDINHFDKFGNVDGTFRFNGWVDSGNGVIDGENISFTGEWKYESVAVEKENVEFNEADNNGGDNHSSSMDITKGETILIKPNGGAWSFNGTTYNGSDVVPVLVKEDTKIADPEREGYKFIGWEKGEEDGSTTLTAKWEKVDEKKDFNWIPVIVAGGVTGGAAAIAGGIIAGGIVAAGAVGIPAAVIAGTVIAKKVANAKADSANNSAQSNTDSTVTIPNTGSVSAVPAALVLLTSSVIAAYVMLTKKKEDKED